MEQEQLKEKIIALLPEAEFNTNKQFLDITVPADKLHSFLIILKDSDDLKFDYLFCLSGVDWKTHFTIVYHLTSTTLHHSMVLKVKSDGRENPEIPTVSDIFATAEFHEREVYDLMGVKFTHHPDLRRLFLDETFIKGFPLRKDYKDEINIIER
ncbi:MAG: NADH-quinone oxidoreductase subunit C [Bacteroidota bacterium]